MAGNIWLTRQDCDVIVHWKQIRQLVLLNKIDKKIARLGDSGSKAHTLRCFRCFDMIQLYAEANWQNWIFDLSAL